MRRLKTHACGLRRQFSASTRRDVQKSAPVVFSGIQPTGVAHIGNYLGALRAWGKLCNSPPQKFEHTIFSIVDLHALTVPPSADKLREYKKIAVATIIASGVDPAKCILFAQSDVPAHAELCWILSCFSDFGYLNRMTQWKSKSKVSNNASALDEDATKDLKLGLFSYPVLQAADILLYMATHVPVGEDQTQHLELTRHIANKFNHTYKQNVFVSPMTLLTPTPRVMSLKMPTKKMSKSDPSGQSRIMISDTADEIRSKINKSVTDNFRTVTYEPESRPGVANLISIAAGLQDTTPEKFAESCTHFDGLRDFKLLVGDVIADKLEPVRTEYERLMAEDAYLKEVLKDGARKANAIATQTLEDVKKAVGIL
ncbi:hypothetical protein V1512DRAFT_200625 [Lipomyces arxii]|uniref:uncharacterized protein n=1 Tax=Lipomyces arxii TaxID=56418 RepID=UPI0034CF06A1